MQRWIAWLSIFLSLALAWLIPPEATRGALFCPNGIYPITGGPLKAKVYRKGELLRIALPYLQPNWMLGDYYTFYAQTPIKHTAKPPRRFPELTVAAVGICTTGTDGKEKCTKQLRQALDLQYDSTNHMLWIPLRYTGALKSLRVTLNFEGRCGGYLLYASGPLPW